jgi:hypothetical protein
MVRGSSVTSKRRRVDTLKKLLTVCFKLKANHYTTRYLPRLVGWNADEEDV